MKQGKFFTILHAISKLTLIKLQCMKYFSLNFGKLSNHYHITISAISACILPINISTITSNKLMKEMVLIKKV